MEIKNKISLALEGALRFAVAFVAGLLALIPIFVVYFLLLVLVVGGLALGLGLYVSMAGFLGVGMIVAILWQQLRKGATEAGKKIDVAIKKVGSS